MRRRRREWRRARASLVDAAFERRLASRGQEGDWGIAVICSRRRQPAWADGERRLPPAARICGQSGSVCSGSSTIAFPLSRQGLRIRRMSPALPPLEPPLPLLITGVAGVAGYNALAYFARSVIRGGWWAFGKPTTGRCAGRTSWRATPRTARRLESLFDEWQFRSVLDCAGNCALRACELDSRLAWRTNVEGLINLASIIAERDVRLVHTSIDLVFAGRDGGGYREEDPRDPVTVYGKTMVAAEEVLADWLPGACVLRISLPMGVSFNGHAGAIDWIQSRFKKGRPATLYFDEVRTPTYADCLNPLFERPAGERSGGRVPRGRAATAVAVRNRPGGQPRRRLRPCSVDGMPAARGRAGAAACRRCNARLIAARGGARI